MHLRVATALSFKLKSARKVLSELDPTTKILTTVPDAAISPQILATLCKLHVNIEGGFGEAWRSIHRKVGGSLCDQVKELHQRKSKGSFNVLIDCMNGADGIPMDRSSRAFHMISKGTIELDEPEKSIIDSSRPSTRWNFNNNRTVTEIKEGRCVHRIGVASEPKRLRIH